MRRRLLAGGAGALAVGLALFASLSDRSTSSGPLVAKLQAQRRALAISGGTPLLALLSPPGAGYDSTNIALSTASGSAVTVTRASTQTCEVSPGTLTSIASNKPCVESGSLKVEPSGTLMLTNPAFANSGGAAPTSWAQDFGTGSSSATTSTLGADAVAYSQSATAQRPEFSQTVSLLANTTYTATLYIEAVTGTIGTQDVLAAVSLPAGATATYPDGAATQVVAGTRVRMTVTVGATAGTAALRVGLGAVGNVTGTLRFSRPQIEASSVPTSWMAVSRAAQTTSLPTPAGLPFTAGTIEATVTVQDNANAPNNRIIYENRDGTNGWGYLIAPSTGGFGLFSQVAGVTTIYSTGSATWTPGTSYRVKAVFTSTAVSFYRDDVLIGSRAWTPPSAAGATSYIGGTSTGTSLLGGTIRSLVIRR